MPETGSAPVSQLGQNRTQSAAPDWFALDGGIGYLCFFYDAAFMLRFMVAFVCLSTDRRGSIYGHRWHPIRRNRSAGKVLLELGVGRFGSD